ncbi:hypothetical protein U1Q18_013937, partial [Sarracenia purpurea var. burkii]
MLWLCFWIVVREGPSSLKESNVDGMPSPVQWLDGRAKSKQSPMDGLNPIRA